MTGLVLFGVAMARQTECSVHCYDGPSSSGILNLVRGGFEQNLKARNSIQKPSRGRDPTTGGSMAALQLVHWEDAPIRSCTWKSNPDTTAVCTSLNRRLND